MEPSSPPVPGPSAARQGRKRKSHHFDRVEDYSGFGGSVSKKLYESSLEGDTTDVQLIFGKFETYAPIIHVHSVVLKTESKVFNVWMTESWSSEFIKTAEGKTLISLPEDNYDDFKIFIKLLYGYRFFSTEDEDSCHESSTAYEVAIPAFQMADKYEAEDVMKLCNAYFDILTGHFKQVNVAKVMLWAQNYHLDWLYDAVLEYIKEDPLMIVGKNMKDWVKLNEDFLVRLLSTDNLTCYRLNSGADTWSFSEELLLLIALGYLRRQNLTDDAPEPVTSKSNRPWIGQPQIAVRILQNIRFMQMNAKHLKNSLKQLVKFLTPHQIGTIYLVCSGIPQDKLTALHGSEGSFIVETKMRRVQDPNVQIAPAPSVDADQNDNQLPENQLQDEPGNV